MYSRRRLLSLLQNARLAPAGRLAAAPPSRSFSLPRAADGAASTAGSSDGHFSCKGSTYAAILIGQAAVVLGLSSNSVLAQDDSTAPAVTSEEADAGAMTASSANPASPTPTAVVPITFPVAEAQSNPEPAPLLADAAHDAPAPASLFEVAAQGTSEPTTTAPTNPQAILF
ncbi:hypothetical protein ZWY2020_003779 [Hordeum vulgare]|nr:hypothetical protein ZWY2020_003779 [Hordeum vulgare]